MNGKFLLDTNIIIALFASDTSVINHISSVTEIFVPVIAISELYYGAQYSEKKQLNLSRIDEFANANVILECNQTTASLYGQIKAGLKRKGRPIPENDLWIASLAIQHNLTLITRDAHFDAIEDLILGSW